jgi:RND superfamily putative drug exporter
LAQLTLTPKNSTLVSFVNLSGSLARAATNRIAPFCSLLARFLVRRRRRVLIGALLAFVVAGALGGNVASRLSQGGFDDPGSESFKADEALEDTFGQGDPHVVLLVETTEPGTTVDDPAVAEYGRRLTDELGAEADVVQSASYWTLGAPPLKSEDGTKALVLARLDGTQDEVADRIDELGPEYERSVGETGAAAVRVRVGGFAQIFHEVGHQIEKDLARAEMIAFPITLVLLVLVFGSVVAASLPLVIGLLAIVAAFLSLSVIAGLTEVSIFALNLVTAMGLGLAIDYALFMVSRFREELRRGHAVEDAVVRTVQTAGRTVAFSALTVAVSLAALLIFPLAFLRSFAYAGISVVVTAAIGAIVVLPALLAALGTNVDKWVLFRRHPREVGEGFWHRVAVVVMRRPIPVATAAILLLAFLGGPFFRIQFTLPDDRVLPQSAPARQVMDEIRQSFPSQEAYPNTVVATGVDAPARQADIADYASRLSRLPNAARVDSAAGSFMNGDLVLPPGTLHERFVADDATWLSVVPSVEPMSEAGETLVKDIRSTASPFPVRVGGSAAILVDEKDSLFGMIPWAMLIIAVSTFVLLFLMFGSVLVPVKALVLNVLSLSATFGAMVWIFQDGHFSGFLDFTPIGALDTTTPILMFCIAFGLSMDYEVFLLSRIKEEWDRGSDNVRSVAVGLEYTGRIVTAAAALLAVVFLAFATSRITFIKLFGIGLTMAVIMDATVIRATLVPAFMRLAGRANWWAPGPLRRLHERWGIREHVELDEVPGEPSREPVSV